MKTTTATPEKPQGTDPTDSPALYVGTYDKYNNGSLKGAWLNLEDYADQADFMAACLELHADETDPEIMFQDFQFFPAAWYCESSAPPEILWEWIYLDEDTRAAFGIYADNMGGDVSIEDFQEAYSGTADSEADFAQEQAADCGDIPAALPNWIIIDWERSWECSLRFDYFTGRDECGTLHFFRNI